MTGIMRLLAQVKNGKTILKDSYCTQPFKLADITEDKKDHWLQLMLMSSSPGILDNDHYKMNVDLEEDCKVQLTTQSYQRIFQMKTGAKQEMEVRMRRGSSFIFLPHPATPHKSSIFFSKNRFYLSEECLLIYGEVLACGRKLNGEVFKLSSYHSVTDVFSSDKLIVKENLLAAPDRINVTSIGQWEGYTHQASFICVTNTMSANTLLESIHDLLQYEDDILFGASTLDGNGFCIRILGYKAEQLFNIHDLIARRIVSIHRKKPSTKTSAYAK